MNEKIYYTLFDSWEERFLAWKITKYHINHALAGEVAYVSHPQHCGGTGWYRNTPTRKMTLEKAKEELAIINTVSVKENWAGALGTPKMKTIVIVKVTETMEFEEV